MGSSRILSSLLRWFALAVTVWGFALPVPAHAQSVEEGTEEPPRLGREVPPPLFRYSARRRELEARGLITYFYSYLGHERGPILAEYLTKWKTEQGQIWHNEQLHLLAITDTPENIELLKSILKIIDKPAPQVMIEVRVVEVNYDSTLQVGGELFWRGTIEVIDTQEKLFGTMRDMSSVFNPDAFLDSVANETDFQGFTGATRLSVDSNNQVGTVDYVLRTLIERGEAEILSAPRILVVNGKQANFLTGEQVPIQTPNIVNNVTNVTTEYKPVGVKLTVTPHVQGESAVELDVDSEVSTVTGFAQSGILGIANPIISTRQVKTTVYVRDGETLIIGGLLRNESVLRQTGVPILMDIPILGFLFKSYRRITRKTELVFFLTPHLRLTPQLTLPPRERER
ncbi:MAG: type II and III secretion system protein [Planctomycetes bacterium]|nr:type II and III secretion system protein [Planctomycetota bacterium]